MELRPRRSTRKHEELKTGDFVTWNGEDDDLPRGTVGEIYKLPELVNGQLKAFVKFPHDNYTIPVHDLRPHKRARRTAPLKPGDLVCWIYSSEDIPSGEIGEIVSIAPQSVCVKFKRGRFSFRQHELRAFPEEYQRRESERSKLSDIIGRWSSSSGDRIDVKHHSEDRIVAVFNEVQTIELCCNSRGHIYLDTEPQHWYLMSKSADGATLTWTNAKPGRRAFIYWNQKAKATVPAPKLHYGQTTKATPACIVWVVGLGVNMVANLQHTSQPMEDVIFEVTPPLPAGISIDRKSGLIGGTPTEPRESSLHKVTVSIDVPRSLAEGLDAPNSPVEGVDAPKGLAEGLDAPKSLAEGSSVEPAVIASCQLDVKVVNLSDHTFVSSSSSGELLVLTLRRLIPGSGL